MEPDFIVDILREALFLVVTIVTILIVPGLLVGLVVSTFQAATSINEQTLSFLPRLLTTFFAILLAGPYLSGEVVDFTHRLVSSIPLLIG